MQDEKFNTALKSVEDKVKAKSFSESVTALNSLHEELNPNDLAIYLTLKSIEHDIANSKSEEFISNEIKSLLKRFRRKRLVKSERWSNFVVAVMSFTLIPALPFIANWINEVPNTGNSLVLSLAIYCISVALSIESPRDRMISIILYLPPIFEPGA